VQLVVAQVVHRHGPERIEADVERDPLGDETTEYLLREVQTCRRRRGRPGFAGVNSLVAGRIGQGLGDVGRQRRVSVGIPVEAQAPASFAEVLEQLDRAVAFSRAEAPRGSGKPFPQAFLVEPLEKQDLAFRSFDRDASGDHPGVVDDDERIAQHVRQLCEPAVVHPLAHAFVDQQSRSIAARHGMLRHELRREVVLQLPRFHPAPTVAFPDMDDGAIERAKERVEQRAEGVALDALIVRAREQVDALTTAVTSLEETLPARVGEAVRDQAQPVGRNLAEIRGLMNQVIRRLERVDGDLLADRNARIDDLALLVDLITSGWQGVDARLSRIEGVLDRLEQGIQENRGAIVYRMEDRRPDAASS
jgi:hypothetical protein